jgi:hypothetical protein
MAPPEAIALIEDERLASVLLRVAAEVTRVAAIHAPYHSAHEGYAVIAEELDELWDEVKRREKDPARMGAEAVQVAATAIRFLIDVCGVDRAAPAPTP